MNKKIRKGIWYIKNGKVPPFWRLLPSKYDPEEMEHNFLEIIDSSCKVPSYIGSDIDLSYTRSASDGKSDNKYFSTITGSDDELHLEIDPEYKTEGCYFQLLNPNRYKKVNITLIGSLNDSSEEFEKQTAFQSGEQMKIDSFPVLIEFDKGVDRLSIDLVGINNQYKSFNGEQNSLQISTPSLKKANPTGTPIFLISIDTFRYDHLDIFEDVKSMLNNAIVPEEPRTQGRHTRPSHASTITGTHPGTHGYFVGFSEQIKQGIPVSQISSDLITLPEVLRQNGYNCGACVSWGSLNPQYGFGRGFQEFRVEKRDWDKYKRDSDTVVNRALEWTQNMINSGQMDMFYFMHIFDAHLPYLFFDTISGDQKINVKMTDKYKTDYIDPQPLEYDELMEYSSNTARPEYINKIENYYENSLQEVSRSIERFVYTLDLYGILDESLIIVVGDHGEEFLETGTAGHLTLGDKNLRPGMLIKPPQNSDLFVPNEADLIDIFPTISDHVTGDVPDQCTGKSWLRMESSDNDSRTRITESFTGIHTYAISVEYEGIKGVFAFDADIPSRPTTSQLHSEPKYKEIIEIENRSSHQINNASVSTENKDLLMNKAIDFIQSQKKNKYGGGGKEIQLSSEAINRLENLGYK